MFCIHILQYDAIFCILRGSSDAASSFYFISKVQRVNGAHLFFSMLKLTLKKASVEMKYFNFSNGVSSYCSGKIMESLHPRFWEFLSIKAMMTNMTISSRLGRALQISY